LIGNNIEDFAALAGGKCEIQAAGAGSDGFERGSTGLVGGASDSTSNSSQANVVDGLVADQRSQGLAQYGTGLLRGRGTRLYSWSRSPG
jgi:hypothetical protein